MEPINRSGQLSIEPQQLSASKTNSQLPELQEKISNRISPTILIFRDTINLGKELGKGGFGIVYEGTWAFRKVAVKCYEGSRLPERIAQEMRHEVSMMLQLDHECLVRLFGIVEEENRPPMLVMEHGANGSLYTFLHSELEISWPHRLKLAEELARGLAYLHSKGIVHRDIKSLNVVLDRDYHAKWCDFGLAQLKQHSTTTSKADASGGGGLAGTLHWMAPELFSRKSSTPRMQSDIWALGMLFYELASRGIPYKDAQTPQQVMNWIMSGEGEEIPEECLEQFPDFASIMQECWASLDERPTAAHIAAEVDVIAKRIGVELKGVTGLNSSSSEQNSILSLGYGHFSEKSNQDQNRQPVPIQKLPPPPILARKQEAQESEGILPGFIDYTYKDPTTGLENTRRIEFDRDSGLIPDIKTKNTWLHIAAMIEHTTMLKAFIILDPKINLEQRNEEDMTPLMIAFKEQKERSIEILLDAGADIYALSKEHGSALHLAATTNLRIIEIVLTKMGTRLNLDFQDSEGETPLKAAIRAKQTDVAIKLIDCGADIHNFCKKGLSSHLSSAISNNNAQVVKHLFQKGVKILPCGMNVLDGRSHATLIVSPLLLALAAGASKEIFDSLIAAGADPRFILNCENVDYSGTNLIFWAIYGKQSPEVLEYLLKDIGLNPNIQSKSRKTAPLIMARDSETLRLLLKYGANPNVKDHDNQTALADRCFGFSDSDPKMIKLLLNAGTDPNSNSKASNIETCFSRFVTYAFNSSNDRKNVFKDHLYELTELFLNKGGKINLEMEKKIRASHLYNNNQEFQRLIHQNTKTCTIM